MLLSIGTLTVPSQFNRGTLVELLDDVLWPAVLLPITYVPNSIGVSKETIADTSGAKAQGSELRGNRAELE